MVIDLDSRTLHCEAQSHCASWNRLEVGERFTGDAIEAEGGFLVFFPEDLG